jgi:FkbM family methyltransferase
LSQAGERTPDRAGGVSAVRNGDAADALEEPFGAFAPSRLFRAIRAFDRALRPLMGRTLPGRMVVRYYKKRPHLPFDTVQNGAKMRLFPALNEHDNNIFRFGEMPDLEQVERLLEGLPRDGVFVDVGANTGCFTLMALRQCRWTGPILAIEAHPRTFKALSTNLRFNPSENVTAVECAVGRQAGTLPIFEISPGNVGQNTARPLPQHMSAPSLVTPMKTLPELLRTAGVTRVDAMKIDIEGYEDEALSPLLDPEHAALLPKRMLMEHARRDVWREDILAALLGSGYRIIDADEADTLLERSE